jgi:hypothetical protein
MNSYLTTLDKKKHDELYSPFKKEKVQFYFFKLFSNTMCVRRRSIVILNLILLSLLIFQSMKKNTSKFGSIDYCVKNNITLNENYYLNIVHIPELNILFCDIPKAASSNLRRLIYVTLNQLETFEDLDRQKIWIDYNEFFKKYYLTKDSKLIFQNKTLFKFLLVRHPFRRIYSAYYDKFVNDHIDDTLLGWRQLEEQILLEMNTNETLLTIRRRELRLDFRTFLLYIINSIRKKRSINNHWEQIVHRCAFCLINYDWIGKIENFQEDQKILLNKLNKNSFKFPSKELDEQEKKQISLNDFQLIEFFRNTIQNDEDFQILIDYYKPDFQIFHYTIPHL